MNILEINKFLYPRRGAERHFLDVVAALQRAGHAVAVFGMRHPDNPPSEWSRYEVSYVGYNEGDSTLWQKLIGIGRGLWSFEARRKVRALLQEFHPDIVHVHNIYHQLSPSILAPLGQSGARIVMTVHDYHFISPDKDAYYESVGQTYWRFLFVKKYNLVKRALLVLKMYWERRMGFYDTVDRFIVPSEFVQRALVRGGIAAERIVVIPHFIAPVEMSPDRVDMLPVVPSQPYALYAGTLSDGKGVNELVAIFDRLETPLVVAGAIEPGFVLASSPYVTPVGRQSQAAVRQLMASPLCTCVVSASRLLRSRCRRPARDRP